MSKSLKSTNIDAFIGLTEIEEFSLNSNSIIIITAFGIIYGKKLAEDDETTPEFSVINSANNSVDNNYFGNHTDVKETDDYVSLKDVTIITSTGARTHLKHLNVFDDQIIGITIGSYPVDAQY